MNRILERHRLGPTGLVVQTVLVHLGQEFAPEYVVEVDQESVSRARTATLRALRGSAWAGLIGGGLICGIALAIGFAIGTVRDSWPLLLTAFPGLILCFDARRRFAVVRRVRESWDAAGIPPVAMRISADGLRCSIDAAPDSLFLPWWTVAGLHLRRWRSQWSLVLDLAPGVTATTPGVVGLDHPDVQRALHQKVLGTKGLRFAVRTLRRPVEEIDQALAHFTNGRVRIH